MIDTTSLVAAVGTLVMSAATISIAWRKSSSDVQVQTVQFLREKISVLEKDLDRRDASLADFSARLSRCEQSREEMANENLRLMRKILYLDKTNGRSDA